MNTPDLQVRRATVDDLPRLTSLWQAERLPSEELARRFQEFQVVESAEGDLLGAIGYQIVGREARLHSEAFAHPEQADALREVLWDRLQVLSHNHGLTRVWTQLAAPFWHHNGFCEADAGHLSRLSPAFAGDPHPWLLIQLQEEPASPVPSVEAEFALFKEAERQQTEKLQRQAQVLKRIAAVIAVGLFLLVIVWAFYFFKAQHLVRPP